MPKRNLWLRITIATALVASLLSNSGLPLGTASTAGAVSGASCSNQGSVDWESQPNNSSPTSVSGAGVTLALTRDDQAPNTGGQQDYQVRSSSTQGGQRGFYQLGMDAASNAEFEDLIITPDQVLAGFEFTLLDVDIRPPSGNYRDSVIVTGELNGVPVLPTVTAVGSGVAVTNTNPVTIEGQSNISSGSTAANATVTFDTPVDRMVIRYFPGANPSGGTNPTRQLIGISDFTWCGISTGAAKAVDTPVDTGFFTVNYTYVIRNTGGVVGHDPQITDDLAARFGTLITPGPPATNGQYSVGAVQIVSNSADPVAVNPAFTGTGANTGLLDGDTGSLQPDEEVVVTVPVQFVPNAVPFSVDNTAITSLDTEANNDGTPDGDATDESTNGSNVDPNGDGNADENEPTPVFIPGPVPPDPKCAVEGRIDWSTFSQGANPGSVTSNNGLVGTLVQNQNGVPNGQSSPGNYRVAATSTQGAQLGYYMMNINSTAVGQTEFLTVNLSEPVAGVSFLLLDVDRSGSFRDQVIVTGSLSGIPVTPTGQALGTRVEVYNDPTPNSVAFRGTASTGGSSTASNARATFDGLIDSFTIAYQAGAGSSNPGNQVIGIGDFTWCDPAIGSAKSVSAPVLNADGTYTATYSYTVENFGGTVLHDVQVSDDLAARFGTYNAATPTAPGEYTVGPVTITTNTGTPLAANPAFTGSGANQGLLDGATGSLNLSEVAVISVPVTFMPTFTSNTFAVNNTVIASGDASSNGVPDGDTTDVSQNGPDPDPDADDIPSETSPTPLSIAIDPQIAVDKELDTFDDNDGDGQVSLGDVLHFNFTVTNTGNAALTSVSVNDPVAAPVTCPGGTLNPGAFITCTATYTVTTADADATEVVNTADATGTPPSGPPVTSPPDVVTTPVPEVPSISLDKSFQSGAGPFVAGDNVTYQFDVTNSGKVTLSSISLDDTKLALVGFVCTVTTLAPGATTTCTANYSVTQADVDSGQILNTASVTGTSPSGTVVNDSDNETVVLQQTPAITLDKSLTANSDPDGSGDVSVDDVLTYTFTVTNTGSVTLDPVVVDDPRLSVAGLACGSPLAPGASATCTADYTVVAQDAVDGSIANTATTTGTSPLGIDVTDSDDETVSVVQAPSIDVVKSLASGNFVVGETLNYEFLVINSGNIPLTSVSVSDDIAINESCPVTVLAPGASTTCTADYVVQQSDVNAGSIDNTVTATGTPPTGPPVAANDTHTVTATQTPDIDIVKTASSGQVAGGDMVTYTFVITNTGNVTLDPVTYDDPVLGITGATCNAVTSLDPGASTTCTADYTVLQADVDAGQIDNTATTTGVPPAASGLPDVTDTDPETVTVSQNPAIDLVKALTGNSDPDGSGSVTTDDVLTYTFTVTNSGNVTLDGVVVTDTLTGVSSPDCTPTTPADGVAPGGTIVCTATYTVTQADVDAGRIDNTADVTGQPPSGPPVTATDIAIVLPPQSPSINVDKAFATKTDADASGTDTVGDVITYDFTITNTGTVTLDPVTLSDPVLGLVDVVCGVGSLAATESTTCQFGYTITQSDVDVGERPNTATANGTPPGGIPPVTDTDDELVQLPRIATLGLTKLLAANADGDGSGTVSFDDVLTYEFIVTNTGNVTLDPVTVTDPTVGAVTCPGGPLNPEAQVTCSATYVVTQADVDAGVIDNTATANGTPPAGVTAPPPVDDMLSTPVPQLSSITLDKVATSIPDPAQVGDTIDYDFIVTNTGNVTLTAVVVSDPLVGPVDCGAGGPLAPGDSLTCTAGYSIQQGDLDAAEVVNTATANATPPPGAPPVPSVNDMETAPLPQVPNWTFVKTRTAIPPGPDFVVGDTLTYEFVVTNTGNVTISNVVVTDDTVGAVTCPATTLAPGASTTCSATYDVTQDDINNAEIVNLASPSGDTPPGAPPLPPVDDTVTTPITRTAGITLDKMLASNDDADADGAISAGDTLSYEFDVTNTGNVPLDPVVVTDDKVGAVTCPAAPLDPGVSITCTASYVVLQADVDSGEIENNASVLGTPPAVTGLADVTDTDTVTTPIARTADLDIAKTLDTNADEDGSGTVSLDDTLTYQFVLTNTGNVTLASVTYTDAKLGVAAATCNGATSLLPGESATCTATYTVTQADIDAGTIDNTVTGDATPPAGVPPIVPPTDTVNTPVPQVTELDLLKTSALDQTVVAPPDQSNVGDRIDYTFVVTNTGNVTMTGVIVTDPLPGLSALTCVPPQALTLAPGESSSCTADYTLAQADIDAGGVANTATANGNPPPGAPPLVPPTDSTTTPIDRVPSIDMAKAFLSSTDPDGSGDLSVGDVVTYQFTITNTGNVTLDPVTYSDAKLGITDATCNGATSLAPQASAVCTGTYTVNQADVDAGAINNVADAVGRPPGANPDGSEDVTDSDNVSTILQQSPSISLAKTVVDDNGGALAVGDNLTYTFDIENDGNVSLSVVTVTDPLPGLSALVCTPVLPTTLAPAATAQCTATYTVTLSDVNAGSIANTATVTGNPPLGPPVQDTDDKRIDANQTPSIDLTKTVVDDNAGDIETGDQLTYTFVATNSGNVTLTNVAITDPLAGLSALTCNPVAGSALMPAATMTCTATYTVTLADVNAGQIDNTASVTGTPPVGGDVSDSADQRVNPPQSPQINLDKALQSNADGDGSGTVTAGDVLTYSFDITNVGNVTLTGITLVDPLPGLDLAGCAAISTSLDPGNATSCTGTYTVTQVDVDAGVIANTATTTGTPPIGPDVNDTDTETINPPQVTELEIVKSVTPPDPTVSLGDVLAYSFLVTNTGTVTMTGVAVSDPRVGPVTCPGSPVTLLPGASVTCTADYTVDQVADVDAGAITNTATATGTPPPTAPPLVPPTDTLITPIQQNPDIDVVKTSDAGAIPAVNDIITYTFTVTNTGDVTLTGVAVTDVLVGLSVPVCAATTLAPGANTDCTATYTVTQADVDAASITNTATASGTPPGGLPPVTDDDTLLTPIPPNPSIVVVKANDADATTDTGDPLVYTFTATNTGNVTLSDVQITDPLTGLSALACTPTQPATLAPNAQLVCTADYTVTQGDVDAGTIDNTASVVGTSPAGVDVNDDDTLMTPLTQTSSITLQKDADVAVADINDTVTYTMLVTNTGNVSLDPIVVTDSLVGLSAIVCDVTSLAPAAVASCTATYQVAAADADAGEVANTATANATAPSGAPPVTEQTDDALVDIPQTPGLTLLKTRLSDPADPVVGDLLTYNFEVENTGNVSISNVVVSDPVVGTVTCPPGPLAAFDLITCTADYTVTQADVDAGEIINTATVTGDSPPGAPPLPPVPPSDVTTPLIQTPLLTLAKTRDATPADPAVGDELTYNFVATNAGNVTLSDVTITDPLPNLSALSCTPGQPAQLAPADALVCTATYTVTQDDVDAGEIVNVASATGTPPPGAPQLPPVPDAEATTPLTQTAEITVEKSTGTVTNNQDGTFGIQFTLTVTNTGTLSATDVSVTDDIVTQFGAVAPTDFAASDGSLTASATWDGTAASNTLAAATALAPGDSGTVVISFTVTPGSEEEATNIASAAATTPNGPVVDDSPPVVVEFKVEPRIVAAKAITAGPVNNQDGTYTLTYRVEVANGGNTLLTNAQVSDDLGATFAGATSVAVADIRSATLAVNPGYDGTSDTALLAGTDSLPVGEGGAIAIDVVITPGSNLGPYLNTAVGTADDPTGGSVTDDSDSGLLGCSSPCTNPDGDDTHGGEPGDTGGVDDPTPVSFTVDFDLTLTKTAVQESGFINYDIVVTNIGPDAAPGPITMTDPLPTSLTFVLATAPAGWSCSSAGQVVTCIRAGAAMPAGESATIFIVTALSGTEPINNVASVESVVLAVGETNPDNNSGTAQITPVDRPSPPLPRTGSDSGSLVLWGVILTALGLMLVWIAYRRRERILRLLR